MNRDDIIRLAHEADCLDNQHYGTVWANKLEHFAKLVAAAERESCERLAWDTPDDEEMGIRTAIALAIRARSE